MSRNPQFGLQRRALAVWLAGAGVIAPPASAQGGPVEGKQYRRLPGPLATTPGKVEVVEFFFYKCPHCNAFDPVLESWVKQLPADVVFRRVPLGEQAVLKLHARMYYALEAMGKTHATHSAIFHAFHQQRIEADDEAAVKALVARLGVDPAKFTEAFNSFGVMGKLGQGQRLAESAGVDSVPALLIGGRYVTSPGMAGRTAPTELAQGQAALAVADHLIALARKAG